MPSTTNGGTHAGNCAKCHYVRIKRYRATPEGAAATQAIQSRYKKKLKAETLLAYGNKCNCCDETQPVFLTIDHVNNDGGGRKREKGGLQFYSKLRKLGYPQDEYQLLCFNCNTGRHLNGGVCPHQEKKEPPK
jgi:hypothetical protein